MDLNDIRQAFSKANIIVNKHGLCVCYTYNDGWFDQTFNDGNKNQFFYNLIKYCEDFNVNISKNHFIKLEFVFHGIFDNLCIFPAIEKEMSLSELEEIMKSNETPETIENRKECEEFFIENGVSTETIDDFISQKLEIDDSIDIEERTLECEELYNYYTYLTNMGFQCEYSDPGIMTSYGFLTICLDDKTTTYDLNQELRKVLPSLMEYSVDPIYIEGSVEEGILNMIFCQ